MQNGHLLQKKELILKMLHLNQMINLVDKSETEGKEERDLVNWSYNTKLSYRSLRGKIKSNISTMKQPIRYTIITTTRWTEVENL